MLEHVGNAVRTVDYAATNGAYRIGEFFLRKGLQHKGILTVLGLGALALSNPDATGNAVGDALNFARETVGLPADYTNTGDTSFYD